MTAPSTVPAFLDAFKTKLDARVALADVGVFKAHPGDRLTPEHVVVDRVEFDQEWGPLGRKAREERYTAHLVIGITKDGAGDDLADDARDRVFALMAEVEDALRTDPAVTNTVRVTEIAGGELRQGAGDKTRWAQLALRIDVRARI